MAYGKQKNANPASKTDGNREAEYPETKELRTYMAHLRAEERSAATLEKYGRDVRRFLDFAKGRGWDKELLMEYKESLKAGYAAASVNSMLVPVNGFLQFCGRSDCCVKLLKIQRQIFCSEEKNLSKEEYRRLLRAAREKKNERLYLILQTICATGIRIGELRFITREAVRAGRAVVDNKGKSRVVLLPDGLCRMLARYIKKSPLKTGSIFVTKSGKPVDRSNIWREMKGLCRQAGVQEGKVFPHSLRHLFARSFYALTRDIAKLADVLGHASIDTTRIYMVTNGAEHRCQIERMNLLDTPEAFVL